MTTDERLEAVERALAASMDRGRLLLIVTGLIMIIFSLVWVMVLRGVTRANEAADEAARAQADGADVAAVLRARSFELIDPQGEIRAVLRVTQGGSVLGLRDANGRSRATLTADNAEPALGLLTRTGKHRALLTAAEDGTRLILGDERGYPHVAVVTTPGGSGISLYDENGVGLWSAP